MLDQGRAEHVFSMVRGITGIGRGPIIAIHDGSARPQQFGVVADML